MCFVCAGKGGGRGQGRETWRFVFAILVNLIIGDFLKRVHVYLYVFIIFSVNLKYSWLKHKES